MDQHLGPVRIFLLLLADIKAQAIHALDIRIRMILDWMVDLY
jgi:hypothetical protein